ncbi:MAG: hypothetical protein ACHQM6_05715 [Candidatus Kapaibacterium sp.]
MPRNPESADFYHNPSTANTAMKCLRKSNIPKAGVYFLAGFLLWCPTAIYAQGQSGNILDKGAEFNFRAKILDSECKPLVAKNETPAELTIEKISLAAGSEFFVLTDIVNLPLRLSPRESVSLGYVCFRPKVTDKEYNASLKVALSRSENHGESTVSLHAKSFGEPAVPNVPPTSPAAIIDFDPTTIKNGTLLSMVGKDEEFFRSFKFKNVSSKTVTVNSIDFEKHDAKFDLSSVEPDGALPIDVAPGETFSVRIAYHSFERMPAFNKMLIYTDDSKDPVRYDIRGLQMPLSQMDWNKRSESSPSQGK